MRATSATALLVIQLKAKRLPPPVFELRFHPTRRWRFDLSWEYPYMVAVEIDGAVWTQGRHTRGSGYVKDMEKLNAAVELGWRVLRYAPSMIESGEAIRQLQRVFADAVEMP